jgi:hypothetical protein
MKALLNQRDAVIFCHRPHPRFCSLCTAAPRRIKRRLRNLSGPIRAFAMKPLEHFPPLADGKTL